MTQIFSRLSLSGASNGVGVALNNSSDTVVHATAGGSTLDEIWLYAANQGANTTTCTLYWGQTQTNGSQSIVTSLARNSGLTLLIPGLILRDGLYVSGRAGAASSIVVYGFVNRITET